VEEAPIRVTNTDNYRFRTCSKNDTELNCFFLNSVFEMQRRYVACSFPLILIYILNSEAWFLIDIHSMDRKILPIV
jgi:hypothetical protein